MKLFFSSYILKVAVFCCAFSTNSLYDKIAIADNLTKIIDKIENDTLQTQNKSQQTKVVEKYAGMVGNKKNSKSISLDISMEYRENGVILLINGNNLDNKNIIKTSLQEKPKRFFIDVFFQKNQDKMVNFTYQLPKDIRLKYGIQDFGGYRIAIDIPSDWKISKQYITKKEISVKFSSDNFKTEPQQKTTTKNTKTTKNDKQQNNNTTNNITIIDNFGGLKSVSKNATFQKINTDKNKQIVVVIDAGHGGIDPGAIGKRKIPEKTITLMYAKRLKEVLESKGFRALLTRNNNSTLQLEKRVDIAKKAKADLFISLHTDAHDNPKITGTTVYRLSHLDEKHPDWNRFMNKTYLPDNYTKYLNNSNILDILIGMTHQSLLEKSTILTENILLDLKTSGLCKYCRHGQRSLAVLRGLDMTSILIELGYITNNEEEIKLLSSSNVEKFAQCIANTLIKTYGVEQKQTNNKTNQTIRQQNNIQQKNDTKKTTNLNTNNTKSNNKTIIVEKNNNELNKQNKNIQKKNKQI